MNFTSFEEPKIFTYIDKKPELQKTGGGAGLYRVSYMYISQEDKKEYYGAKAFYYLEDAKRFIKLNK